VGLLALMLPFGLIVLAAMPVHSDRALALWAVPLNFAFLALLSVGVFELDTYRNDGKSRWATGDGTDHILYIVTVGIVALASGLFVLMAARKSSGWVVRPSLASQRRGRPDPWPSRRCPLRDQLNTGHHAVAWASALSPEFAVMSPGERLVQLFPSAAERIPVNREFSGGGGNRTRVRSRTG
jgi:hypothetical protein